MLPPGFEQRPLAEWNGLVADLMEAWEEARRFGCQRELEEFVTSRPDGAAIEFLSCLRNGHRPRLNLVA